jgi:hypothetical protein
MINSIKKPKFLAQYAYVLKTKQLEDTLINDNIDIHVDLYYWFPQIIGTILEGHFWLPNANVPYNRLYIRAGALLKEDVSLAREKMTEIVLPQFGKWVKTILSLPDNSPKLSGRLYFNAVFQNGELQINR